MKKTTTEWLKELPDGIREKALANQTNTNQEYECLSDALLAAFVWGTSREGFSFWQKVDTDLPITSRLEK